MNNSITVANATIVGIPKTQYRFTATLNGSPFGNVFTTPFNRFTLYNFQGTLTPNTTYSITVEYEWNGAWQAAGIPCTLTTPNILPRFSNTDSSVFEVNAYPNPSTSSFKIDINTSSEDNVSLKAYDMLGRLVDSQEVITSEIGTQEIGTQYPAGVYTVEVAQGENIKTLRVIKR
jgi:hypothetical protein